MAAVAMEMVEAARAKAEAGMETVVEVVAATAMEVVAAAEATAAKATAAAAS